MHRTPAGDWGITAASGCVRHLRQLPGALPDDARPPCRPLTHETAAHPVCGPCSLNSAASCSAAARAGCRPTTCSRRDEGGSQGEAHERWGLWRCGGLAPEGSHA